MRHEEDEWMEQLQYCHFPSRALEGAGAMVMYAGDHDRIGCFADQVKLAHALVWDLEEAIKEVKLLGDHEEESSRKITELEALCKRLREDAQKLREGKATLEGMVKSRDELIMEIVREYGLNHMGGNNDDEDEDDDDGWDAAAPPTPVSPAATLEENVNEEAHVEMVPEQEAPVVYEDVLADAEPELPQPRLFNMIMRDYKKSPPRMMNGPHELDDLDDKTKADYDVDEWFPEDGSNDRDWVIESKS
jgi:hypothetical protein